jgi:hypothetical protein
LLAGPTLLIALAAGPARAADPTAFLIDEPPLSARLAGIDREWNVSFRVGERVRVVPIKDLAYWGRYADVESGPQILLAGGGVIRADVLSLDDRALVLGDATGLGRGLWDESTLPRSAVRGILYQPPADAAARDRLLDELAKDAGGEDRLLLVGGESVRGVLTAAPLDGRFLPENQKPGQGVFQLVRRGASEPLALPAAKVVALSLAAADRSGASATWLGLRDGSLVGVATIEVSGDVVSLKLAGGGTLVTTLAGRTDPAATFWDEVTLIQSASPRVTWLSDLKTLGYKHIPFLATEWPFAVDRTVTGTRLRTGDAVFLKGLGMHTTSRLAYDVAGFRKFEAELALDATAGRGGSVIYKVLLQGAAGGEATAWTPAYESPVIRGHQPPVAISIDLKGASRLALIVEFADRGDELDHANWLNARLVK